MSATAESIQMANLTSNKTNRQAVRAIVIKAEEQKTTKLEGDEPGKSKALSEDPFEALEEQGRVISPPFDLLTLAMLEEHNTELGPCLEAMEINIEGFGHRLIPRFGEGAPADVVAAAKKEKVRLTNFFAYANLRDSFTTLRRKHRKDLESTGNSYFEVIRSASGKIQGLTHVPSYQMRLGKLENDACECETPILELQEDGSVKVERIKTWERFRLFVQARSIQRATLSYVGTHKLRWFKEFGDHRHYDNETGELLDEQGRNKNGEAVPESRRANEMIHFKLYSPRSPYGLPRFIGQLLSIFGDRAAEEINYVTFRNNNIPSMMLLVSNGQLTDGTINRLKEFVQSQIQGDNYSKFLIIEAEGEEEGEDGGQVKIDAKPLVDNQHKDAMFQEYSKSNQDRIRRAFRLPPILVGKADDYTRSTAETSRKLADEQIFAPERDEFDGFINRRMFPEMEILYHRFRSNSPNTTENLDLVKILSGAEKTGGMTPRIARKLLEDILGMELPPLPAKSETFDPDSPFSLSMAEAVKNKADAAEPGQQLTALKTIEELTGGEVTDEDEAQLAQQATKIQQHFEKKWLAEVKAGLKE